VTNKERVLESLQFAELCDDCLSDSSGVRPRQAVYALCRTLSEKKSIYRHRGKCDHCRKLKLVSRVITDDSPKVEVAASTESSSKTPSTIKDWFWEGNIQSRVVSYLAYNGYAIQSVANTATREAGKDIVAVSPDGEELWVSVKGYPEKSSNVQARHWFSGALFDLILYHGEAPDVKLALAFPIGFTTYKNLLPRIEWLKQKMQFQVFWVSEDGTIQIE